MSYNRSYQKSPNREDKEWRPKSPCVEVSKSGNQQGDSSNAGAIVVGAHELKLKEPVVDDTPASSSGPFVGYSTKTLG